MWTSTIRVLAFGCGGVEGGSVSTVEQAAGARGVWPTCSQHNQRLPYKQQFRLPSELWAPQRCARSASHGPYLPEIKDQEQQRGSRGAAEERQEQLAIVDP